MCAPMKTGGLSVPVLLDISSLLTVWSVKVSGPKVFVFCHLEKSGKGFQHTSHPLENKYLFSCLGIVKLQILVHASETKTVCVHRL